MNIIMDEDKIIDFGGLNDKKECIIKVVGVGGGGCNAVKNIYEEGEIADVSFAVCNTDKLALDKSPVPVKVLLGTGLGAGADPQKGKTEAEQNIDDLKKLFSDGTQMAFITAAMGGGTGTGAGPVVAGVAKSMGILTIGIVTLPFYFEKRKKIIKSLKGVEEMRKNVDALLIVNNERICDVYSNSELPVKEAFKRADDIVGNATKSISELITLYGTINLDFRDVQATMTGGGGAIMAIGRASGEHRVEKAFINALDSPLLYGNDISRAKRVLFNIYTSSESPLVVRETSEVDSFMEELDPNIEVIWGISDDDTLGEDAKVTILATGLDDSLRSSHNGREAFAENDDSYYDELIDELYSKNGKKEDDNKDKGKEAPFVVEKGDGNGNMIKVEPSPEKPFSQEASPQSSPDEIGSNADGEPREEPYDRIDEAKPLSFIDKLKTRLNRISNDFLNDDEDFKY